MAKAATSTSAKPQSQKPPASKAPTKAPTPPPANESRIVNGVIERYTNGKLISRTPAKPATQPAAKLSHNVAPAATSAPAVPQPPASIAMPRDAQNSEHFVAKLGTEDIWSFKLVNPKDPSQGVVVTHYKGYAVLSRNAHKPARADQIYHDMLAKGLVYVASRKNRRNFVR